MVTSIKDPDALAAAACKADLVSSQDTFSLLCGCGWSGNAQAKTRSLLQVIEGKVKGEPIIFHQFLAILRNLPGLFLLASQVQANYGMYTLSFRFSEFIVPQWVTDTRMATWDVPLPSSLLPSAEEKMITSKADSKECISDDVACEAASSQGLSHWLLLLVVALVSLTCRQ